MRAHWQECFDTDLSQCGSLRPQKLTRFSLGNYYNFNPAYISMPSTNGENFSNYACIRGEGWCEPSECIIWSSCCGQQANFFSKMLTYRRSYWDVKITIMPTPTPTAIMIFPVLPKGQKANGDHGSTVATVFLPLQMCPNAAKTNATFTLRDVCYNARWFWTTIRYGAHDDCLPVLDDR